MKADEMQPITYTLEQLCDKVQSLEERLISVERAARDNNSELHGLISSIDRVNQKVDKVMLALAPLQALGTEDEARALFTALAAREKTWRQIFAKLKEEIITRIAQGVIIIFMLGVWQWIKQHIQ